LPLLTPTGEPCVLGTVLTHPWTVVQLVRYFGCLPCQEWLVALDRAAPELAARSAGAVAVGGSTASQALWLQRERQVEMPLLLDPEHTLRSAVGAQRPLGARLLDPRGLAAYARTLTHGYPPQRITKDTVRSPGVVILDTELQVRWRYLGRRLGDYPALDDLLAALDRLQARAVG
jgi:hypothetical protein